MHPYTAIYISLSVDIPATWPKFVSRLIYARSVISLSVSDVFIESTLCLASCRVTPKILLKTDMSKNFQFHTVHRLNLLTIFCIKQSTLNKEKTVFGVAVNLTDNSECVLGNECDEEQLRQWKIDADAGDQHAQLLLGQHYMKLAQLDADLRPMLIWVCHFSSSLQSKAMKRQPSF